MNEESMQPIVVNESPVPDQLAAAARVLCVAAGSFLIGRGWLSEDTAAAIGVVLMTAGPFLYGQWKTRQRARQLASIARSPFVPDAVAQTK
jgi:hypothetical protein